MSSAAFQFRLRLVGSDESAADVPDPRHEERGALHARMLAVAKENRLAAHAGSIDSGEIDRRDPRWILAMQTRARLQGTMLTPERREQLLRQGRKLGLRPFDSNLVIAVVQDEARCRRLQLAETDVEPEAAVSTTSISQEQPTHSSSMAYRLVGAIAAAVAAAALLIMWLVG